MTQFYCAVCDSGFPVSSGFQVSASGDVACPTCYEDEDIFEGWGHLCTCKGEVCRGVDGGSLFHCSGCDRKVPFCFGAADGYFELCDDCWHEEAKAEEAKKEPLAPLVCLSCQSDQVSHVDVGPRWSSQCLDCAHVWWGTNTPHYVDSVGVLRCGNCGWAGCICGASVRS